MLQKCEDASTGSNDGDGQTAEVLVPKLVELNVSTSERRFLVRPAGWIIPRFGAVYHPKKGKKLAYW